MSNIHLLGIRHHGPGSAQHVKQFIERVKPDIVLIEGPPEAESILKWVVHKDMKPPVAILAYEPDNLKESVFYPFAEFSPEWQGLVYAFKHNIPVRFIDLPLTHKMGMKTKSDLKKTEVMDSPGSLNNNEDNIASFRDPFDHFALLEGYEDGENWWEDFIETRQDSTQVFDAVEEAVIELRDFTGESNDPIEKYREAWMRKCIREAQKEMFNDIVVICGAWHVPSLKNMPKVKEDQELLKGLPKVKIECTWVPWTYSRLMFASGYGAGIHSPGWYHHIWKTKKDVEIKWLTKVAHAFRKKQLDISSAHIIETVRLAETLAALRGRSRVGITELQEATLSTMCMGETLLTEFIRTELVVSPRLGRIPQDCPKPPLQVDIEKSIKRLRLPLTEEGKEITLDLREEKDLEKSIFLHRLSLLDIPFGNTVNTYGKGTFKEGWFLQWKPEFSIEIIDKGSYGNTVQESCTAYITHLCANENSIEVISERIEYSLLSNLPEATQLLLQRINDLAASTGDVLELMKSLPNLTHALRYGNVRNVDTTLLSNVVSLIMERVFISLPMACAAVDEEASNQLLELVFKLNESVATLQKEEQLEEWKKTLDIISLSNHSSPLVAGYTTRLLHDYNVVDNDELEKRFGLALSTGNDYSKSAYWIEGFLKGSGTILLIDEKLWAIINTWLNQLDLDTFTNVLPLLRRTFSTFTAPERRKLGEKAKGGTSNLIEVSKQEMYFNHEKGMKGVPIILQLLNINQSSQ